MRPRRESKRHVEAFEFYWSLGDERSLEKVAQQYGVTKCAAQNWSAAFSWVRRIDERNKKIAERLSRQSIREASESRARLIKIAQGVQAKFIESLQSKDGKLKVSVADFEKVAKLEMTLRGIPTFVAVQKSDTEDKGKLGLFEWLAQGDEEFESSAKDS